MGDSGRERSHGREPRGLDHLVPRIHELAVGVVERLYVVGQGLLVGDEPVGHDVHTFCDAPELEPAGKLESMPVVSVRYLLDPQNQRLDGL